MKPKTVVLESLQGVWQGMSTFCVKPTSPGSASHLQQLIVTQQLVAGALPPGGAGNDGAACRHVDAGCQRPRGKHHLDQACSSPAPIIQSASSTGSIASCIMGGRALLSAWQVAKALVVAIYASLGVAIHALACSNCRSQSWRIDDSSIDCGINHWLDSL